MKKPLIYITFGTRPEAIKMAPLVKVFLNDPQLRTKIVLTAQHREMLDQVMEIFNIPCDIDFNIMAPRQTLSFITQEVMTRFSNLLNEEKPSLVLVHGDTTTTFASTLASFYQKVPVAHVEAGLRSHDLDNPFPEEMNRKLADTLCSYHFCPTAIARENLLKEGINPSHVIVTGNTIVDALLMIVHQLTSEEEKNIFPQWDPHKKTILMTMHRRESWGDQMKNVAQAVNDVLKKRHDVQLLFPMHRNPAVREIIEPIFSNNSQAFLTDPLDYRQFVMAMKLSYLIISDSGGIQEEAPSLNKPVLLTRKVTERPEGLSSGVVKLVGTEYSKVFEALLNLIDHPEDYRQMVCKSNPFGDGKASLRIHRFVRHALGLDEKPWQQESEAFQG